MKHYAPHLLQNARTLRKNMTKEERKLWYEFLKPLPLTVKRQALIGRYIADFYIPSLHIAIELDGSQHFEDKGRAYDEARDAFFAAQKILVLRYPNNAVNRNFSGVCEDILRHLPE
ncbi:MAG: endonuclease domain-containing protein [Oscillospiraceae bacterium]|nr:endonuclease domain-containing protein [Oscillospiraceae bacterium]